MKEKNLSEKKKHGAGYYVALVVMLVGTLTVLVPIYWMVVSSLKSQTELMQMPPTFWPQKMEFSNYARVFEQMPFGRYYFNSVVTALLNTVMGVFTSALSGYVFAKYQFKGCLLYTSYLPLQEVLTQSDIVVITCPLTDETHHLMNEKSLRSMKPQAFLVNCSRGPIVDTKALAKILREGKIAGAALDVYEEEPLLESELFSLPNTVLTPHMAGLADREIHNVAMQSAYNMADLLEGKEVKSRLI